MNRQSRGSTPGAADGGPTAPQGRRGWSPRTTGWVTLGLGVWMVLAPSVWIYGDAGGLDARWNDMVVGFFVAVIGAARLVRWHRRRLLTVVSVVIGAWLVVAPFVVTYGYGDHATRAAVNDVVIGLVIAALAIGGPAPEGDQNDRR